MELINAKHGFFYNSNSKEKLNRYAREVPGCIVRRSKGNPKRAAELAGYSKHSYPKVVRNLKKEITELAENHLSTHSAKAATSLTDLLDEDGTTPHASVRLAAATQILDRIGIVKKDQLDNKYES